MKPAYKAPLQNRALSTEQRFLDAMGTLLEHKSLGLLTIDDIAAEAGLTRSAFFKRFGSKNQALLVLYSRYCDKVLIAISEVAKDMLSFENAFEACYRVSMDAEQLQASDFAANRAMHELFMENLQVHPLTQGLFKQCFALMKHIQRVHLPPGTGTDAGAHAATQLIFTINYNHVLRAMPGLPRDTQTRHQMIANFVKQALEY
jgi:AcrR family transcriptional regulator